MIHEPPIVADTTPWDIAEGEVDRWRGACIQVFARSEAATTETLIALAKDASTKVKLPHLVGARFEALYTAVAIGGGSVAGAPRLKAALDAFREHDDVRTILCHGVAQVAIDRRGEWIVVLRCTSCRSGSAEQIVRTFTVAQAAEVFAEIQHDAQVLSSLLGQLRKSLKSEA